MASPTDAATSLLALLVEVVAKALVENASDVMPLVTQKLLTVDMGFVVAGAVVDAGAAAVRATAVDAAVEITVAAVVAVDAPPTTDVVDTATKAVEDEELDDSLVESLSDSAFFGDRKPFMLENATAVFVCTVRSAVEEDASLPIFSAADGQ